MPTFLQEFDAAIERLARNDGGEVHFDNQPMPAGAVPAQASITFVVRRGLTLRVSPRVQYGGPNEEVRLWLRKGECRFPEAATARNWVRHNLRPLYVDHAGGTGTSPPAAPRTQAASALTDLQAVRQIQGEAEGLGAADLDPERFAEELGRHVFGQDHVLRPLAAHVCRHLARVNPRRPCTCWFAGPTGVGKTRTAELVSGAIQRLDLRGIGYAYTRLDMSEYGESHRRSQLLGAPQGYVGHGEGAQLVDDLSVNPRRVVLFDEIEKAHSAVLQTLMNAMDAGRLSSPARTAAGSREVDCRRAIFIFTTNLDSDTIVAELARTASFNDPARMDEVCRSHLRAAGVAAELVGRIGRFFVFKPLSADVAAAIVAAAVRAVAQEYGVEVGYIEPTVIVRILERTGNSAFGARPHEYAVDEVLGAALTAARALRGPVRVSAGPPPHCVLVQSTNGVRHGDDSSDPASGGNR